MRSIFQKIKHAFRHEPTCEEVNQFLVEYLEGVLDPRMQTMFQDHLRRCPKCKPYMEQYLLTMKLVHDSRPIDPPEAVIEHTLEFLKEHLAHN